MRKFVPAGSRILEVGCAAGFFLKAARDAGYDAHGVEVVGVDPRSRARRPEARQPVRGDASRTSPASPGSYDAAALWDVVEHLADPLKDLVRVRELLKPGGHLFVQTQDVARSRGKILGAKWPHFKQLEHVYHFSPRTITTLLERAGFEVLRIQKRGAGKYISIGFFIDRMRRFGKIPHLLALPLTPFRRKFVYVNPWDEIIVAARVPGLMTDLYPRRRGPPLRDGAQSVSSRRLDRLLGRRRRRSRASAVTRGRAALALLAHTQAQAGGPRCARTRSALQVKIRSDDARGAATRDLAASGRPARARRRLGRLGPAQRARVPAPPHRGPRPSLRVPP